MNARPNILFIFSDQHNSRFMGCAGNDIVRTPNLDKLASEGVIFDNAYCQNPVCVPSRTSMLTGQYSRNTGIYCNNHILEANCETLPRFLSQSGYRTCMIGKAHFNGEQFHGYQQRPYGDLYGQGHQPDPRRTVEKGPSGLGDLLGNAGPSGIPLPLTQTEICVAESAKWLQTHIGTHPEQPFFLSVNFDKPHFPINPPKAFFDHYDGKIELPSFPENYLDDAVPFVRKATLRAKLGEYYGKFFKEHTRALSAYYGCVEWVDDGIGRILETLEYLGLAENTMVIYSSDHGEMAYEKGSWQKTLFFDAATRVPLIIRWPHHIPAGRRSSELVGLIDLFPTLCAAAQCSIPDTCEGVSLLPLLLGTGSINRDAIFSESVILNAPEHAGCMIRTGPWKYCYYLDGNDELYNLEEDPGEWENLVFKEEFQDVLQSLKSKIIDFWKPEEQLQRYHQTPRMSKAKHFYEFSNQFILGDGTIVDAKP